MFRLFLLFLGIGLLPHSSYAQSIVSVELQENLSLETLATDFPVEPTYGLRTYKVRYLTTGLDGAPVTVSGMLSVPDAPGVNLSFPLAVYMHGTAGTREGVPSRIDNGERTLVNVIATNGFITLAPDYLGLGDDRSVLHPYVHAETEARVGRDMLLAIRTWLTEESIGFTEQLFLTGYSQGGHASMALHRDLETRPGTDGLTVTAAAHLSGPYSISKVMTDIVIEDQGSTFPGYLAYTYLSYNQVYQVFEDNGAVFQEPYLAPIDSFARGELELSEVNQRLNELLSRDTASLREMFHDSILALVENEPNHPLNIALRDNDVFDWAPNAPTVLVACTEDEQVPFRNAILADSVMRANGAVQVQYVSGGAVDHFDCIRPAVFFTLALFDGLAEIVTGVRETEVPSLVVHPNPIRSGETLRLATPGRYGGDYRIYSATGRLVHRGRLAREAEGVRIPRLEAGVYHLLLENGDGAFRATFRVE